MKIDRFFNVTRNNPPLVKAILIFTLVWIISGCRGTTTPTLPTPSTKDVLLPESNLTEETVQQLFLVAGEHRLQEGSQEMIEVTCTITEGTFCWFAEEDFDEALYGLISKGLARTIVNEIDASVIDQARSNEVQIRCGRSVGSEKPITCEGNWGWEDEWLSIHVK
jgi:hypothetical protein